MDQSEDQREGTAQFNIHVAAKVFHADKDDACCDERFDNPCGDLNYIQSGESKRHRVRDGETSDDRQHRFDALTRDKESEKKKKVIVAGEDVFDAEMEEARERGALW